MNKTKNNTRKTAVIIGAGPAGLTAAYELLKRTDIRPLIFEADDCVGGLSRTVRHGGNYMDIGGHRFFSKSERVISWWAELLPMPERRRLSRIYFLRKFFDYPIRLDYPTLAGLGFWRVIKIGFSYFKIRLLPIRKEKNLEDFFINRFGRELYVTFFRDYTAKVWGRSCREIGPEWGEQRVKGLSVSRALGHALKKILKKPGQTRETSLIESFLYPPHGPGQLWEEAARRVKAGGGEINFSCRAVGVRTAGEKITGVAIQGSSGKITEIKCDYLFSGMPVKELIAGLGEAAPDRIRRFAHDLVYRDFITVGLLFKELKIKNKTGPELIADNWLYIQEAEVKLGRIQIFNNWSPDMVKDRNSVWLGLEYFCFADDDFWKKTDDEIKDLAADELARIGIIAAGEPVLDSRVIRMKKAYPAYFGKGYDNFSAIREFTDKFPNLFLIGRNGMHRYNNQDHSMLSAMTAVDNIIKGKTSKENIWAVNAEQEYHEGAGGAKSAEN